MSERTYWHCDLRHGHDFYDDINPLTRYQPVSEPEANLVSSLLENGKHAPAIDIDVPCRLVESSTPGHYHLYIEKEMDWTDYLRILFAMARAGVVEWGFYNAAVRKGQTHLRKPGVSKYD